MMRRKIKKSIYNFGNGRRALKKNIYNICMYYNEVTWFDQNLRI